MPPPLTNEQPRPEFTIARELLTPHRTALQEFAQTAAYSSLQSPLKAVSQLVDEQFGTETEKSTQFMASPQEAEFMSSIWCAQQAGIAAGTLAPVLIVHTGVSLRTRRMVSPQFANSLISRETQTFGKGAFLASEAALTGMVFGGLFTPSDKTKGELWSLRGKQAIAGGSTFATLSGTSSWIKALGERRGTKLFAVALKNDVAATTMAGIPAGIVSANSESLLSGHGLASMEQQVKAAITMSATGAGMGLSGRYFGHLTNSSIPRLSPQDFAEPLAEQIPSPTPRTKFLAEPLSNPTEFAQNSCRSGARIIDFDLKVKTFSAMPSTIRFPEIRWPVEPGMMVITGGPGVGKSTVINFLRDAGYPVSEEVAAQIIKAGEYHPLLCKDTFQRKVFAGQVEVERQLVGKSGLRFLDRGLLDGEPYYMVDGAKPPAFFSDVPGNSRTAFDSRIWISRRR